MNTITLQAPTPIEPLARWLSMTLDHVGRGMLLVGEGAKVLHANRLARQALGAGHPLAIDGDRLRARHARDADQLLSAIEGATRRGLRRMVSLGDAALPVAVLPLDGEGGAALISLPRTEGERDLALPAFARQHGLTEAETSVLEALVAGESPSEIAERKGVRMSTIRTQIGQLRVKTGAHSIRELVELVAALPPMPALLQ